MNISLFIHRRDLRITDNTGLIACSKSSDKVICVFILTPEQVDNNKYKSSNAIQFMINALYDLDNALQKRHSRLIVMYGEYLLSIKKLYKLYNFSSIYVNEDYTPYSIKRDMDIHNWCKKHKLNFISHTDCLLTDSIYAVKSNSGTYYKNFSLFYKKAKDITTREVDKYTIDNFMKINSNELDKINQMMLKNKFYSINENIFNHEYGKGGRKQGLKILLNINKIKYSKTRDIPSYHTTGLSVHNKFGTISIREFFSVAKDEMLIKQLYWRDFYYYVCFHYPVIFSHKHLQHLNASVSWPHNKQWFTAWKNGTTGFPLVDAGMRELNTTGYIHNRVRLVVAMFVIKDLLIDWKYAEQYFSNKLIDIDRCQNTGNWNWSSSFGLDNTAFLRIFNPWTQSLEYDYDCIYIKRWVPELKNIPTKEIHKWFKYCHNYDVYYKPIVDHSERYHLFKKFYKKMFT